jgi:catechol 2,3-dioxygenase-like lactoylglutathione lyase family enzyme
LLGVIPREQRPCRWLQGARIPCSAEALDPAPLLPLPNVLRTSEGRYGGGRSAAAICALAGELQAFGRRRIPMRRTWTIIGVGDVPGSFKWYQSLLGLPETAPAHDHFGQILDSDGTVLLCLHEWGAHEHPSLMSPDHAQPGNGLLLFFRVDDFDMALPRARALVARLEEEPHVNPNTGTGEFSLRDPDGYYVTISGLSEA